MIYNDLTRHHFATAGCAGSLAAPGAVRGSAGNREHGTWVQFDFAMDGATVRSARFLAFGCPHTIAVAASLAEQAPGTTLRRALPHSVHTLATLFAVPADKMGRLLIIEDAWVAAAACMMSDA